MMYFVPTEISLEDIKICLENLNQTNESLIVIDSKTHFFSCSTTYLRSAETSFSVSLLEDWARERSIRIFLQMSRSALAIVRAATSHLDRQRVRQSVNQSVSQSVSLSVSHSVSVEVW